MANPIAELFEKSDPQEERMKHAIRFSGNG